MDMVGDNQDWTIEQSFDLRWRNAVLLALGPIPLVPIESRGDPGITI
jgi:hypothetical protein